MRRYLLALGLVAAALGASCSWSPDAPVATDAHPQPASPGAQAPATAEDRASPQGSASTQELGSTAEVTASTAEGSASPGPSDADRPAWLGTRVLPRRPDGFGVVRPTPAELQDRRLATLDLLAPPAGDRFVATAQPVADAVVARSTWSPRCPVAREDLRYLTVTFWGFDERPHTGELLVHVSVAEELTGVFRRLYEARFPIEEMRVVAAPELDAPPTGDGNNTTAFVCRPTVGAGSWSQHAYGLAVDVNPFHNPYRHRDLVLPELASAYTDRDWLRPGMIQPGDEVTGAFAAIGWGWGGTWSSLRDWMHFSRSGR